MGNEYSRLTYSLLTLTSFEHVFLDDRGWAAKATFPDSLEAMVLHMVSGTLGNRTKHNVDPLATM